MNQPRRTPITVAVGGEAYTGAWHVDGGRLEITSPFGSQSAELGRSTPEALAPILLVELVRRNLLRS